MFHSLVLIMSLFQDAQARPVLEPQPMQDEAYAETFTAVASLDDGSYVLMQLLFTNAGMGDRKAACRGLWVPPGGKGVNASINVSEGDWSYDGATDSLQVGSCQLTGFKGAVRFRAELPSLSVDLLTKAPAVSTRPPDHRVDVEGTFYESDILVPRAVVDATINASGRTLTQRGYVHLDHSRSNSLLPRVAGCWMRFRGFEGDSPMLAQVRVTPEGSNNGWSWALSSRVPSAVSGASIVLGSTGGLPSLKASGASGPVEITAKGTVYRYRPTEAYGALGRLAAPWIGDPTTTTYSASATVGSKKVKGILEVSEINRGGCRLQ